MKTFVSFFFLLYFGVGQIIAQQKEKISDDLFAFEISSGIWVVKHYSPWESNSLIIKASASEVVLVDTPYTDDATEKMLEWISQSIGNVNVTAISTGFHIDNIGGNACLRKHKINIYGSKLTAKMIEERAYKTQQQVITWLKSPAQDAIIEAFKAVKFTKPNKLFDQKNGKILKVGDLTFDIYYPGESHTPDNLIVYIPEQKLLFGGCMIKSVESSNLGYTGDANMKEWPGSVQRVIDRYPDVQVVIPHHGMWGNHALLQHTLDLFHN